MDYLHVLNVHKPAGVTSRDVVNLVQKLVRPAKIGHAGTLDPLATGVLMICIGQATRLIDYIQQQPKQYRGMFLLGRQSETEDVEGAVLELKNPPQPTREELVAAARGLTGEIWQRPPAFSALKVNGRRAYDLARKGETVELAPRKIEVSRLTVEAYDYPTLTLDIECSTGTYVRSLGRDLAESVGTAAVMSALVRTAIGPFRVEDACDPSRLTRENLQDYLLPATAAIDKLPRIVVTEAEQILLANGQPIRRPDMQFTSGQESAALSPDGRLVAIVQSDASGKLWPRVNFKPASNTGQSELQTPGKLPTNQGLHD